jgi:hypothetical protein
VKYDKFVYNDLVVDEYTGKHGRVVGVEPNPALPMLDMYQIVFDQGGEGLVYASRLRYARELGPEVRWSPDEADRELESILKALDDE